MTKLSRVMHLQHARTAENAPAHVQLNVAGGGLISVIPHFVMALEPLTASTARIIVAGRGQLTVDHSYTEVLELLANGNQ